MATPLYFTQTTPEVAMGHADQTIRGVEPTSSLVIRKLETARGSGVVNEVATSIGGPTGGLSLRGAATVDDVWLSDALSANVTISGTITFNLWGSESSMSANACFQVKVLRLDNTGAYVSLIANSERGTELATSNAANNWTVTATSTNMVKGDRIAIYVGWNDATSVNMGSGFTLTYYWNGTTAAASGDSYVQFNETLTFVTAAAAGTVIYPTDTVAEITPDSTNTDNKEAWTSRGGSAATCGINIFRQIDTSFPWDIVATDWRGTAGSLTFEPSSSTYSFATASLNTADGSAGGAWSNIGNVFATDAVYATVNGTAHQTLIGKTFGFSGAVGRVATVRSRVVGKNNNSSLSAALYSFDGTTRIGLLGIPNNTTSDSNMEGEAWDPVLTPAVVNAATFGIGWVDDNSTAVGYSCDSIQARIAYAKYYDWYTKKLTAFTLSDKITANLRVRLQNAPGGNAAVEIAVCNADGTGAVVYGRGIPCATASTLTETAYTCDIIGPNISVTDQQRIRIRFMRDATLGPITGAFATTVSTDQVFYNGPTGGASGDTFITFSQTLTEAVNPVPLAMDLFDRRTPRRRTIQRM